MVFHHDSLIQAIPQCATKIIAGIIINQSAGINAHLSLVLNHHSTERTHKSSPTFRRVIGGHAALGDLRSEALTTGCSEVRKRDQPNLL